jgi:hypothetical protein
MVERLGVLTESYRGYFWSLEILEAKEAMNYNFLS